MSAHSAPAVRLPRPVTALLTNRPDDLAVVDAAVRGPTGLDAHSPVEAAGLRGGPLARAVGGGPLARAVTPALGTVCAAGTGPGVRPSADRPHVHPAASAPSFVPQEADQP